MGYEAEDYDTEDFQEAMDAEDLDSLEELAEDDFDDDEGFEDDYDDDEEIFVEDDYDDDESIEDDYDDDEGLEDDYDDDESIYDEMDDDDDEGVDDEDVDLESVGEESSAERSSASRRRALRLRAAARRRAAARARAARARQRVAARRSRMMQARLRNQLRRIRVPTRVGTRSLRTLKGPGVVTARLPNGRTSKMIFTPALATRSSVNSLTRRISANDRRQAKAIAAQARSIKKLRSAQSSAIKSISAQQVKNTKDLSKRIAAGDGKLDKRISKELRSQKGMHRRHRAQVKRALEKQRQRSLWNNIMVASAIPLFAAYGSRSKLLAPQNLWLAGGLGVSLVGDELIDRFLTGGKSSGMASKGATAWSYAAPFANAGAMYLLLKDYQHERFVTGQEEISDTKANVTVDLSKLIGSSSFDEFKQSDDHESWVSVDGAAVAGVDLAGKVKDGKLEITSTGIQAGTTIKVNWKVDTLASS